MSSITLPYDALISEITQQQTDRFERLCRTGMPEHQASAQASREFEHARNRLISAATNWLMLLVRSQAKSPHYALIEQRRDR